RGLAGIRVAHQRNRGEVAPATRLALRGACRTQITEITLQPLDALQQAPAVDFELGLTGTAGSDTTTLLAQLVAATAQAREPVAQLRQLDLHGAVLAGCVLSKDVEDQRDPIDHVDREELFEVALLRRRELVV